MTKPIEVLITLPFPKARIEELRAVSNKLHITAHPAQSLQEVPHELWEQTEVLYTNHVLPTPLQAPRLKWIQFHWAGIDRLKGAPIFDQVGVAATTQSGIHAPQMGEYVLMMMLALGHKMPRIFKYQNKNQWPEERWETLKPIELRTATVGIVGYGSIGRQTARLLHTFGATVLATKFNAMQVEDPGYIMEGTGDPDGDYPHRIYPFQALKSMLTECDFVVVAVPLTDETRGLIGAEELAVMKPTAYIVDVSRGTVIDHNALIPALKEKRIAGAALDVFSTEPLHHASPLWQMDNVILTPHIAGVSAHYDERAMGLFAENLKRYLSGENLLNQFDFELGY